ncbi:MAG: TonB-dependent receptor [Marinilabiliales bacterium]|nr:TonB-dependent receptor [Marinilabiliales bacterium]
MKKLFFLFFLFLTVISSFAQQEIKISGKVTDSSGHALPGVTVAVKGTTRGVITDMDGNYSLQIPGESTLTFSFIGFKTQEVAANHKTTINIHLEESTELVEEVVVVGYGTQKVKDLTSSISTVKSQDLAKTPAGQAIQALQGKVAGMQVVSQGGPGNSPTVRVRGIGSYPGNNNEAPLYVVDGIFFDNIDFLNPADIASISVLKDASASAIYGVRAANGVVLIETKSGTLNQKTEIVYDGYYGTQVAQNVLKMANAEQFVTMAQESGSAPDYSFILNAMQRYGRSRINPNVPDVNTDWYKEILRPAPIQNHSLSVSGGNQKASYALGASYFGQEGILDMKNDYERFNLRTKLDFKANDWLTLGGNVISSNAVKYGEEASAWSLAYYAVPILPVYDDQNVNATPDHFANAQDLGYRSGQNPFPTLKYNNNRLKTKKYMASFYAKVDLIPEKLSFKTSYNNAYASLDERNVNLPYFLGNSFQRPDAAIIRTMSNFVDQTWDNVLTYTNKYKQHGFTVMLGTSFRDEAYNSMSAKGLNFPIDQEQSWYIDQAQTISVADVKDSGTRQYGVSYFGRLSYNFADKYLLYGTMRADGSSKYQQKWGYFPTVGAGWVLSEEDFLKGNKYVNFLKLRASWGQLGNDKIQASDGATTTSVVNTAINGVLVAGAKTTNTFSSLKWEVAEETNVGVTAKGFKNRLSLDADYYIRDTKNAAIYVTIPAIGGSVLKNVGIIRNSGIELSLNWNDEITKDLHYTLGANISTLKNTVRDLYGQPYIDGGSAEFRQRSIVGQPLLAFYGREVIGVYQNQAEINADPIAVANKLVPGDFKYKDQDGNKILDDGDRVVLGSYFPNLLYGFNCGITYKNLELTANVTGQSGNKILNRKRGEIIWTADGNMDADLATNRWHGEGTSDKYPSSSGLRRGWNQKMSNYFVEDGSFVRIQNIQLAYNLKKQHLFGVAMPETRFSLTADRPLTFFKYNGFNPEVANGIDTQTYPIPAVYTVGLNIKF